MLPSQHKTIETDSLFLCLNPSGTGTHLLNEEEPTLENRNEKLNYCFPLDKEILNTDNFHSFFVDPNKILEIKKN